METDSMKLLLLCLTIITLIFPIVGFRDRHWNKKEKQTELTKKCNIFWFIINSILFIGFIFGIIAPPQPMIYMIACFVQGFFVIIAGIILAVVAFILGRMAASSNESVNRLAAKMNIVECVLGLLEVCITGSVAYFSFKVWKLGG